MTALRSPALRRLAETHDVADLTGTALDHALAQGTTLLFFTGDPGRYREIDDVAVVLPELMRAFAGRFRCAMIDPDADKAAAIRFRVTVRPTLVLVRDGTTIGSIPRMRNWSEYLDTLGALLDQAAARPADAEV